MVNIFRKKNVISYIMLIIVFLLIFVYSYTFKPFGRFYVETIVLVSILIIAFIIDCFRCNIEIINDSIILITNFSKKELEINYLNILDVTFGGPDFCLNIYYKNKHKYIILPYTKKNYDGLKRLLILSKKFIILDNLEQRIKKAFFSPG